MYITEIATVPRVGYYKSHIKSLKITLSNGTTLQAGSHCNEDAYHRITAPAGYAITGLYGRSGSIIDGMGAYASPVSYSIRTFPYFSMGGCGGRPFDLLSDSPVSSVTIRTGSRVDNVKFTYADRTSKSAGGNGGTARTLILQPNAYIVSMDVSSESYVVHLVKICFWKIYQKKASRNHYGSLDAFFCTSQHGYRMKKFPSYSIMISKYKTS